MKVVAVISGGMDSITLLHFLKHSGVQIKAISFNYGQKHMKELFFAKKACKKLGIEHQIVDLTGITHLISNSALTGNTKVPHGHYAHQSMKKTVVPNRNMIMLSIAIGYAENLKYKFVAIANHAGDHPIYPDCRGEFIDALSSAATLGTFQGIKILAPFTYLTKGHIAFIGSVIGIDYDKETWSCYEGGLTPCGKCGTCVEREEALDYARGKITSKSFTIATKMAPRRGKISS